MSVKYWSPGLNGTAFIGMLEIAQPAGTHGLYVTAFDYAALERELAAVKQDREDHADYRDSDCAMLEAERDALKLRIQELEAICGKERL